MRSILSGLNQDDSSAARRDGMTFSASNFSNQFFTNLLREDQPPRLSNDEVIRVCVIIVTATYCMKTLEELEKRLKAEVSGRRCVCACVVKRID
ncbi:unnamed protein product [Hydatigera taeniaeformis]|uniref:Uncharacterized protein n=1 Tax=Hydatigena taeniaeformis TaxID=6205 RepID=A0A0R3XCI4_HYDTA|nr:unnamed protein product [Hydatigera taeniaeformis]